MGDRTHWNDCWKERTHHDCAVARIYERDARIAELEAAQPVTLLAALDASIKRETHLGQLCGEAASRIAERGEGGEVCKVAAMGRKRPHRRGG